VLDHRTGLLDRVKSGSSHRSSRPPVASVCILLAGEARPRRRIASGRRRRSEGTGSTARRSSSPRWIAALYRREAPRDEGGRAAYRHLRPHPAPCCFAVWPPRADRIEAEAKAPCENFHYAKGSPAFCKTGCLNFGKSPTHQAIRVGTASAVREVMLGAVRSSRKGRIGRSAELHRSRCHPRRRPTILVPLKHSRSSYAALRLAARPRRRSERGSPSFASYRGTFIRSAVHAIRVSKLWRPQESRACSRPRFVVLGEGGGLLGALKKPVRHVQEVGIVELRL
jgi:hypothetical protein